MSGRQIVINIAVSVTGIVLGAYTVKHLKKAGLL